MLTINTNVMALNAQLALSQQTQAIFQLYPNVITISGDVAYDVDGIEVSYDIVLVDSQVSKNNCSVQAKQILNSTDWTSIADVGDPTKANPYLVNQAAFISYRSTVRNYAVNPVVDPVFPTAPTEQWSS
jgi:hypothetical protein